MTFRVEIYFPKYYFFSQIWGNFPKIISKKPEGSARLKQAMSKEMTKYLLAFGRTL